MEHKQLRCLVTLADELHFGRAATRLGMSQSALSVQIAKIERDLDVLLFRRNSRWVTVTPTGRALLSRARRLCEELDAFTAEARGGVTARVSVATVLDCDAAALRESLDHCLRVLALDVVEDVAPEDVLLERLRRREVDLVLGWVGGREPQFTRSAVVARERVIVAGSSPALHAAAAAGRTATATDLDGVPILVNAGCPAFVSATLTDLGAALGRPPARIETRPGHLDLLRAVLGGPQVALLPRSVARCMHVDGVVTLGSDLEPEGLGVGLLWHEDPSDTVGELVQMLQHCWRTLGGQG